MANLLNGLPYSNFGLIVQNYQNLLNMPSRLGNAFYYWGDFIEPLVLEQDIHWSHNEIRVNCIWDGMPRYNGQTRFNTTLEECLFGLREMGAVTITADLTPNEANKNTKTFTGVLKEVTNVNVKEDHAFLTIVIEQDVDDFSDPATLPVASGSSAGFSMSYTDDLSVTHVFDFWRDFNIIVKETRRLDDVPKHKLSERTVYNIPKKKTEIREWGQFKVYCAMERTNATKLLDLKKFLSLAGLKKLGYRGFQYDCFLSQGFEVVFNHNGLIEFTITLNVDIRDAVIQVYGNDLKIQAGDSSPRSEDGTLFAPFDVREGSATETFVIKNEGGQSLQVGPVNVNGSSAFTISRQPSSPIPSQGEVDFDVNFNPTQYPKVDAAFIEIENGDVLYNPYPFKVAGSSYDSSLVGILNVAGNGISIPDGDTTPIEADNTDFGDVQRLQDTNTNWFFLINQGTESLTINSISVGGTVWAIGGSFQSGVIGKNGVQLFSITFDPALEIAYQDTVTINWTNNQKPTPITTDYTFQIKGTGIAIVPSQPILVRYQGTLIPHGSTAQAQYGTLYPDLKMGSDSLDRVFEVSNIHWLPITSSIMVSLGAFSIPVNLPSVMTPDQWYPITVRCEPQREGSLTGVLTIKTEATTYECNFLSNGLSPDPINAIRVTGNGREIALSANLTSPLDNTNFGTWEPSYLPIANPFVIENIGNTILDIQEGLLIKKEGQFSVLTDVPLGDFAPGDTYTFHIQFDGGGLLDRWNYDGILFSAYEKGTSNLIGFSINIAGREDNSLPL